jgi:hypothetical protein
MGFVADLEPLVLNITNSNFTTAPMVPIGNGVPLVVPKVGDTKSIVGLILALGCLITWL